VYRSVDTVNPVNAFRWGIFLDQIVTTAPNTLVAYFLTADWPETLTTPTPSRPRWTAMSNDNSAWFGDIALMAAGAAPVMTLIAGPPDLICSLRP
jgi:hypothetical protein